ncbi:DUF2744 domain-containing protein [Rhodococcus sp. B10]|uniref:phage gene 29 protein family protein n=1 Tax=Rhodococcus sp. B10 TaxID=2695876 RepID=UPI00169CBDCE|nr:DUF2744 domain-containing protein [Rhodococcus sp. B10]NIL77596.1 hypothetical protein [Rhodococcus sp. B10]
MPRIPTQQWCLAQEDPKKRHQWLFVGSMVYGATARYTPDDDSLEVLSERIPEGGYVHVSDLHTLADADGNIHVSKLPVQTKKLKLPAMGQHHTLNNTSQWVDFDEPDSVPMVAQDMDAFTTEQNQVHFQQLLDKGFRPPEEAEGPATATVETDPPKTFNPTEWTPSEVKGYLLGQDDTERRRVLALEMLGKRRDKILNYPDWKGL